MASPSLIVQSSDWQHSMAEQFTVVYHHFVAAMSRSRQPLRKSFEYHCTLAIKALSVFIASEECVLKVSKSNIVLSIA